MSSFGKKVLKAVSLFSVGVLVGAWIENTFGTKEINYSDEDFDDDMIFDIDDELDDLFGDEDSVFEDKGGDLSGVFAPAGNGFGVTYPSESELKCKYIARCIHRKAGDTADSCLTHCNLRKIDETTTVSNNTDESNLV